MTIVHVESVMLPAMKAELRAMPVTIPGSAIGSTSRNEIVSRPKKRKRETPKAAIEPSTSAIPVAVRPTRTESHSDVRTSGVHAAWNQCVVNPGIGQLSTWTIVTGHATFCVVVVYNNVLARLRRSSPSLLEASQDLGADGWQTFRFVVWPVLSTALVAGGLLAFALSFDEVIVTTFTAGAQNTLPLLILGYIRLGQQLPVVNVIAFAMILLTAIPVLLAQRLMRDSGIRVSAAAPAAQAQQAQGGLA